MSNSLLSVKPCDEDIPDGWLNGVRCPLRDGHTYICSVVEGKQPALHFEDAYNSQVTSEVVPLPRVAENAKVSLHALVLDRALLIVVNKTQLFTLTSPLDEIKPVKMLFDKGEMARHAIQCIGVVYSREQKSRPFIIFYRGLTGNHIIAPVSCLNDGCDADYFSKWDESNVQDIHPDFVVGDVVIDVEAKNTVERPSTCVFVFDSIAPFTTMVGLYSRHKKSLSLIQIVFTPMKITSVTAPCEMRPVMFKQPLNSLSIGMFVMGTINGDIKIFVGNHLVTRANILQAGKCEVHSKLLALRPSMNDESVFLALIENENGNRKWYECFIRVMPTGEIACDILESISKIVSRSNFWVIVFGNVLTNFAESRQKEIGITQHRQNGDWTAFADALWKSLIGNEDSVSSLYLNEDITGEDAWNALLESDEHALLMSEDPAMNCLWETPRKRLFSQMNQDQLDKNHLFSLSEELHLIYESSKMNTLRHPMLFELAALSMRVAELIGRNCLVEYYAREFPSLASTTWYERWDQANNVHTSGVKDTNLYPSPFFIYDWLRKSLTSHNESLEVPKIISRRLMFELPSVRRLNIVCRSVSIIHQRKKKKATNLVEELVQAGLTVEVLETLPLGVAMPIREVLQEASLDPLSSWPIEILKLVGRPDIVKQNRIAVFLNNVESSDKGNDMIQKEIDSIQLALFNHGVGELPRLPELPPDPVLSQQHSQATSSRRNTNKKEVSDGTECDYLLVQMRFPNDKRIDEVRHLLQWSKRVTVPIEETAGVQWESKQQRFLSRICLTTLSAPVGRGAFTLSLDRVDDKEDMEFEEYPPLMLDGRTPSGHDVFFENKPAPFLLKWPLYHSGVAQGLRIAEDSSRTDTNVWQMLNKYSRESRYSNAGFLLGAGLQGHLPRTATARILELLAAQDPLISISVLLSMSVNNAGTSNDKLAKMLYMNVPFLQTQHSSAVHTSGLSRQSTVVADSVEIHPSVEQAAFIGLGYLYRGTGQQDVAEALLHELLLQPTLRAGKNRQSYALSLGFGLGMTCLGCGDSVHFTDADSNVDEANTSKSDGEHDSGKRTTTPFLLDSLVPLIVGGAESVMQKNARRLEAKIAEQSQKPLLFSTNGWMFTDVTAPGAIIAIALTYMGTQNESAANAMCVPSSRMELETMPSHQLLLRVLGRCLIMWDKIEENEPWIRAQLPSFLQDFDIRRPTRDLYAAELFWAGATGAAFAMALHGVGNSPQARELLKGLCIQLARQVASSQQQQGIRQSLAVFDVFMDTLCISLALVSAGTGDLDSMRILRYFRIKSTFNYMATYGHYMARNVAIGILFLGGGLLTFKRTKESIASLLCAFYPLWPVSPDDNTYHLQALRHLYVDAVVCRLVVACDVDTLRPVQAIIKYTHEDPCIKRMIDSSEVFSPFTLPMNTEMISTIRVLSKDFLPLTLHNGTPLWLVRAGSSIKCSPFVFFVKHQQRCDIGFNVWSIALASSQEPEQRQQDYGTGTTQDTLGLLGSLAKRLANDDESGLSRIVTRALTQECSEYDGGDEGILFVLRVIVLLWSVSHSVPDSCGIVQLPPPNVMEDVGLLLCRPSSTLSPQVAASVRKSLLAVKESSLNILTDYIINGHLPNKPLLRHQLFSLLAFWNVPQRDILNALRVKWNEILHGQQKITHGHIAELVCSRLSESTAETQFLLMDILMNSSSSR